MKFIITWIVLFLTLNLLAADTDILDKGAVAPTTTILVKPRGPDPDEFHKQKKAKVRKLKHLKWQIVELANSDDALGYIDSGLFESITFNRTYQAIATPNDPLFSQQWAHRKIESQAAWDISTGNDVVVAVIDTGINFNHPDLIDNIWTGPNGEHGYTALNGVLTVGGMDDHFHGTHCAGIIGAMANNGIGVAGINWRIKLAAFKFLTSAGSGTTSDAILLIDKMIDLKLSGVNIRVSNNSWGGSGFDPALEDAFREAGNAGIIMVCAAGNSSLDTDLFFFSPSSMDLESIVSVLASDEADNKAPFSNYGVVSTDLLAPGVNILSTGLGSQYLFASGTSMASPHVAGALAMVFARNSALAMNQAKSILLDPSSYDRTAFIDNSTGGGRLNTRKLWGNPLLFNPPPANHAPVITLTPNTNLFIVPPDQTQTITMSAIDPDGDPIIYGSSWYTHKIPWLMSYIMGHSNHSFSASTGIVSIVGKHYGLAQPRRMRFVASDGRGAGGARNAMAFTDRDPAFVYNLPEAVTGFRCWLDESKWPWFRLDVNPNYPAISSVRFHIKAYGGPNVSGGGFGVNCCFPPNVDHRAHWNGLSKGSYSIRGQVTDALGNWANSPSSFLSVSNSTLQPPQVRAIYNTTRGPAPLHVTADLRGTLPGSATRLFFVVLLLDEGGITFDIFNPVRQFTLNEPGIYAVEFTANDYTLPLQDRIVDIFTVLPPDGSTNQPPPQPPVLIAPSNLIASYSAGVMTLQWSDNATGEDRIELQLATKHKGPWTAFRALSTLPADSRQYSYNTGAGQYQFRAKACKTIDCSEFSNVASIRVR